MNVTAELGNDTTLSFVFIVFSPLLTPRVSNIHEHVDNEPTGRLVGESTGVSNSIKMSLFIQVNQRAMTLIPYNVTKNGI